jgi:hypothetical protein
MRVAPATVSFARSSLLFDSRRYIKAVLAVTFPGLLVSVQPALLLGLCGSVSMAIDKRLQQDAHPRRPGVAARTRRHRRALGQ